MGKRTHLRGQNTSEIPVKSKHCSHTRKEDESLEHNTDELVKYMSKLPSYLQGDNERQSNDVLNVGVLDWSRLEKWKQQGRASVRSSGQRERKLVSTTTLGSVVPKGSSHQYRYQCHRCRIDDQVHASSLLGKVKASRALQHSSHPVTCTLDPEFSASRDSSLYKQETATCSFHNNKSSPTGRRPTSEMGNSGGSLGAKKSEKRAGEIHAPEARERGNQCANNKLDGEENHHTVLLRSTKEFSGEPSHKSSLDDNVKVTREVSSFGLRSQVPRSSPLSFDLERDSEDVRLPLGVDLSGQKECFGGKTRHSKTASRILDQEKKRHTSPSKRFSFSFGQALTSSSSSDDTTNKSDSMRCDGSAFPPQSSNPDEKHCGSSRVSPLRRLLDHPLLKSKGSENVLSSKERSTSSNPKPTNMDEKKKQDASRIRALFQLTTRNGIPLFQFVVDDDDNLNYSRRILGATMKNSVVSSYKDDSVQYCTFYSVDQVKKKRRGRWLIHGHKEKQQQGGFVYTVIGQMRLCNSDITEKTSENVSSIIREAVLVDETEQQVVKGSKEVAAVVIKKKKPAKENMNSLGETIVIIPGGVHSFPEEGAPTPLVSRWRSGGLCDCGGWDVGCKLHVLLSNKTTLLHDLDHQSFKLFAEEESDQDSGGPVLEMTEVKTGMYRVEFDSFLSHLQAFFVCLTVIKCASEEETVSNKSIGKSSSSSPFAPPLSPVGRV